MKAIEQANTALIAKDVLSHCFMVYNKFEPCEGGCRVSNVTCIDIAGSFPDMIKSAAAKQNSDGIKNTVKILRTQKGL